jgi:GT2 family glycosyltransferase
VSGPDLSVIVPTYRRPELLGRCLASLAAQSVPSDRFEIVVANDGSGDRTEDVLSRAVGKIPNLRWTTLAANAGPATARNRGVDEARAGLLLFLDDDIIASSTLVATHLHLHEQADDPLFGVLGLVRWDPGLRVTPFMRWLDASGLQFAYDTWLEEGAVEPAFAAFYTANLSMHRRLFFDSGGFDERFPHANYEDIELAWRLTRLGFRLHYRPDALAYHARSIDLRTFCRRMANEAESATVLRAIQPEFPLDESDRQAGQRGPRRRLLLRLVAPAASLAGWHRVLETRYRAEIAAAYISGSRRDDAPLEGSQVASSTGLREQMSPLVPTKGTNVAK